MSTEKTKAIGIRISEEKWRRYRMALLANGKTMQESMELYVDNYIAKFGPKR